MWRITCIGPFVASVDGMLAPEAKRLLQRLAGANAHKTQRQYSQVMRFLTIRISIALVKASHHCLRGSRRSRYKNAPRRFSAPDPIEPDGEFRMLFG